MSRSIIENMICMIPARAGSKRLKGKNLMPLDGKPMIAYSIETAIKSQLFNEVYVCTEDPQIALVAESYGAKVPLLIKPELCNDLIASHIPCQYMAEWLIQQGHSVDTLVCLQPTSPLRNIEDLMQGTSHFLQNKLDFLVSVTLIDPHYFHWALQSDLDGNWQMYFGDTYMKERPLLPSVYRPNGSIKIANLKKLKKTGHFFGNNLGVIQTPNERSIHVATQFDFDLCCFLLNKVKGKS